MATLLTMPSVMANATEAVLQRWLVEAGATIAAGDELAEIETDKAVVELQAEAPGIVARILVADGATVAVGDPIAVIAQAGDSAADIDAVTPGSPSGPAPSATEPTVPAAGSDGDVVQGAPASGAAPAGERLFASPLVRRLARDAGLSLEGIAGSGPRGRVVRLDLERVIAAQGVAAQGVSASSAAESIAPQPAAPLAAPAAPPAAAPAPAAAPVDGAEIVPLTRMRAIIARRLTESKTTVPHFYVTQDVHVDALLALRSEINASGARVSVNDLVVKAIALALRDVPEANVSFGGDHLLRYHTSDICIAVATDGGLVTPVIRGADALSMGALSRASADLVERARAGSLRLDELQGGTFSVSNLGMYGTREFAAILNPPQSGILAVGTAAQRPVVVDGELAIATVMTVTLSADHRAIDGAVGAQLLEAFRKRVEQPLTLLI